MPTVQIEDKDYEVVYKEEYSQKGRHFTVASIDGLTDKEFKFFVSSDNVVHSPEPRPDDMELFNKMLLIQNALIYHPDLDIPDARCGC